jgi:hypothetical protein
MQAPPEQTSPDGQGLLQPPQFAVSVWVLVQVPLQLLSPAWQLTAQLPPEQT